MCYNDPYKVWGFFLSTQPDNDLINRFPARLWGLERLHEFRDLSKMPSLRPQLAAGAPPSLVGMKSPEHDALEDFLNESGAETIEPVEATTGFKVLTITDLDKTLQEYFKSGLSGETLYKKLSKIPATDLAQLKMVKPETHAAIMTFLTEYGTEGMSDLNL